MHNSKTGVVSYSVATVIFLVIIYNLSFSLTGFSLMKTEGVKASLHLEDVRNSLQQTEE